ncbi:hypothetical protein H7J93_28655 [Mycobacterium barrassiae]|nr:hypothetical protein [Mycobacterium barrassiae]MCV7303592.1 hypothetical protein [Mycobacterium barrassiae]
MKSSALRPLTGLALIVVIGAIIALAVRACQMVCVAVAPDEWSSIDGCDY